MNFIMTKTLTVKDLERIGFKKIGEWTTLETLKNPDKKVWMERKAIDYLWKDEYKITVTKKRNIAYAFVLNDDIKYIGQSADGVVGRFKYYIDPGKTEYPGHSTNRRINVEIYNLAQSSSKNIDILVFFAPDYDYMGYNLNLAIGLEGILIDKLAEGGWNRVKIKKPSKLLSKHSEQFP